MEIRNAYGTRVIPTTIHRHIDLAPLTTRPMTEDERKKYNVPAISVAEKPRRKWNWNAGRKRKDLDQIRATMAFGQKVDAAMTARGLSAPQVAELVGLSATSVRNFRHGRHMPRPEKKKALCELLGITDDNETSE